MADKEEKKEKVVPRARKFARLIKKGRDGKVKFQAYRKSPTFKRNKKSLQTLPRNPKYLKKSVFRENTFDRFSILIAPCTSERFYKKMEKDNTIIFYVNQKANKQQIKSAFKDAFGIKPQRVNTMNTVLLVLRLKNWRRCPWEDSLWGYLTEFNTIDIMRNNFG